MTAIGFEKSKAFYYENGFYLTSDPKRLHKLISHYELYKKIIDLPGEVVEFGVFKGASLIRFATFRECLETFSSRKIFGFDAFGDFPVPNDGVQSDPKNSYRNSLKLQAKAFQNLN
ncbi:hypothetical protein Q667_17680 [Marinobacter sp. C1S70]|uniref:TylF/MycF/NovP-related O-methyltransferase n=1 Tax=Marinobacter sp. C1S70 TaxID=1396859 RepID=UPI0003B8FB3C|nr:hypothetical protein Q667_17680 [Marinobacter sp. C1S70]